jgi:light-regulated signal transduction histidine kinase (bacteriophytochrome)
VEQNVDGMIVVDTNWTILYLNPAAERLFNRDRAEVIGHNFAIPWSIDTPSEINFPGRGSEIGTGELRAVRTEWEGREAFLISVRDITDRKRAEQYVLELNEELENRVKRRTEQLEAVNRELEAFNYAVSHDLRTPLARIDGYATLLLGDLEGRIDPEHKGYLERIRAAVSNMVELTDGLLQLSRLTGRKMEIQEIDLSAVARQIVEEHRMRDPNREVRVTIASDLRVHGDLVLLRATMENLLGNSWKFTAKQEHAEIEVGATAGEGGTTYFVRDNGAGFDMARIDELFCAFKRLHDQSDYSGTGVGLTTVQRIIHRHGGRVWATAEVDKGATFFFTLGRLSSPPLPPIGTA